VADPGVICCEQANRRRLDSELSPGSGLAAEPALMVGCRACGLRQHRGASVRAKPITVH
jgi:hypothetical protein